MFFSSCSILTTPLEDVCVNSTPPPPSGGTTPVLELEVQGTGTGCGNWSRASFLTSFLDLLHRLGLFHEGRWWEPDGDINWLAMSNLVVIETVNNIKGRLI